MGSGIGRLRPQGVHLLASMREMCSGPPRQRVLLGRPRITRAVLHCGWCRRGTETFCVYLLFSAVLHCLVMWAQTARACDVACGSFMHQMVVCQQPGCVERQTCVCCFTCYTWDLWACDLCAIACDPRSCRACWNHCGRTAWRQAISSGCVCSC